MPSEIKPFAITADYATTSQYSRLTHETSREGRIRANLAINLDQPLLHNALDFVPIQGILQPVSKEHDQRNALPKFVWSR